MGKGSERREESLSFDSSDTEKSEFYPRSHPSQGLVKQKHQLCAYLLFSSTSYGLSLCLNIQSHGLLVM